MQTQDTLYRVSMLVSNVGAEGAKMENDWIQPPTVAEQASARTWERLPQHHF